MALRDWTIESGVVASVSSSNPHSGNGKFVVTGSGTNGITRGSSQQATVYVWVREGAVAGTPICGHLSYGATVIDPTETLEWQYFKVTFWYDSANDTRWGRVERWTGSAWTQIGNDTNFGSGSPALNPIRLTHTNDNGCGFDDIIVYKKAL